MRHVMEHGRVDVGDLAEEFDVTSETIRRDLAASGLVPLERSTSIPTGVDPDRFAPNAAGRTVARRKLGLDDHPNTSYPAAIKSVVGW